MPVSPVPVAPAPAGPARAGVVAPAPGLGSIVWSEGEHGVDLSVSRRDVYSIVLEAGALRRLGDLLDPCVRALGSPSLVVVTDEQVAGLHLAAALRGLLPLGLPVQVLTLPPGEPTKSIPTLVGLWDDLRARGAQRRSLLVALGGGVLCDLVGFAASTYLRGVPYVNVPTTLMAQTDGAVGGKVGVDHPGGKNLIGAFFHPVRVVVDPLVLRTLPRREVASGLAEIVKVAVLTSPAMFAALEALDVERPPAVDTALLPLIRGSIAAKLALLAPDPFERSLRRLLNFGHAVGHALEAATDFAVYRHGEAVAVGMATATELAAQRGLCGARTRSRILGLLRRLDLPTVLPEPLRDLTWERLQAVYLVRNASLREVAPRTIGHCQVLDGVLGRAEYDRVADALARG